jgi:hypothetical protein
MTTEKEDYGKVRTCMIAENEKKFDEILGPEFKCILLPLCLNKATFSILFCIQTICYYCESVDIS